MLRPGSVAWLVAWDLRLASRGIARRISARTLTNSRLLVNMLVLVAFMHLFGGSVVFIVRSAHPGEAAQLLLLTIAIGLALAGSLAAALSVSVNLLFVRNDLELLCSTPVPTRSVFTARSLSIATQSVAMPALLLLPAANVAVFAGGPRWLAAYPVVLSLGLSASAIGLALTLVLVRTVGARAARSIALFLSILLGACVFLGSQITNLLDPQQKHALFSSVSHWLRVSSSATAGAWFWYPARALRGEPTPLIATVAAGAMLFQLSVWLLPRGFAVAMRQSGNATSTGRTGTAPFRTGLFTVLLAKEWRTIYRDPQLLARTLQRLLGLVPGMFILLHHRAAPSGGAASHASMVAALTILAGLLADNLVWLSVCADDAPELLASAPRASALVRRMKLAAILLPIWGAALALLAVFAWRTPWMLLCAIAGIGGVTTSAGIFQLWNPVQISRKDIRQRHRRLIRVPLGRSLAALAIYIGWGCLAWGLTSTVWWLCLAALPVALAGPVYAWSRRNDAAPLN